MNVASGCLVVVFTESANDQAALEFQTEVFETSIQRETKGIIFDVSGVALMDSFMSRRLLNICRAGLILGKKTVVVGLKPAVVAALVDLDIDLSRIRAAVNIEAAIAMINPSIVDTQSLDAKDISLDEEDEAEEEHGENEEAEDEAAEVDGELAE